MRVVSLVPSITELVWSLASEALVGRTRFCTVPPEVKAVPHVGGTKNPDVERIIGLKPDLVIANREENRREDVEAMLAGGLKVLLTDPNTMDEALEMMLHIGGLLGRDGTAREFVEDARLALAEPPAGGVRVFVPIWHEPLMGLGAATYGHDVLERAGAVNVLAGRERYPEVTPEEVAALRPDLVLLPDEPFPFGLGHLRAYEALAPKVRRVPGEWLWWYGPRIGPSMRALRALLREKHVPKVSVVERGAFATAAADTLLELARQFDRPVVGLPTGNTPIGMYEELARRVTAGKADISAWRPFAIDEYGGPAGHPGSNRSFFARYWDAIPGAPTIRQFDPEAADRGGEAARFATELASVGGLDIAVLGIGMNGHVAFNEPGSAADSVTRVVELAAESRQAARAVWGSDTPRWGMTLGMKELLAARVVVIVANGETKAEVVRRGLEDEPAEEFPVSLFQRHPEVTWVLDEGAAGAIER